MDVSERIRSETENEFLFSFLKISRIKDLASSYKGEH